MARLENCGAAALAAVLYFWAPGAARSEDLPAVSGPNGKIEFDAGVLNLPSPMFTGYAAGSLALPVGQRFGLQVDLDASFAPGLSASAVIHGFARDPQGYLIGGAFGMVALPGAVAYAAGPEAELYLDRWTLAAWGGLTMIERKATAPHRIAPFVTADVSYYPTDNWRFSLGASLLDGFAAAHFGTEYLFETPALPLALTGDARIGQDGAVRAMIGLRAYISPEAKSLIRRHREDAPLDRRLAQQVLGALGVTPPVVPPVKPPKPDKDPKPDKTPTDDPSTSASEEPPPVSEEPSSPPPTDEPSVPPDTGDPSPSASEEPPPVSEEPSGPPPTDEPSVPPDTGDPSSSASEEPPPVSEESSGPPPTDEPSVPPDTGDPTSSASEEPPPMSEESSIPPPTDEPSVPPDTGDPTPSASEEPPPVSEESSSLPPTDEPDGDVSDPSVDPGDDSDGEEPGPETDCGRFGGWDPDFGCVYFGE